MMQIWIMLRSNGRHAVGRKVCQPLCCWLMTDSDCSVLAKVIHDNDIESEDPTSRSASDEDVSTQGGPSRSTGTPTVTTRPLTTRQAVLASMVDASHVSLSE